MIRKLVFLFIIVWPIFVMGAPNAENERVTLSGTIYEQKGKTELPGAAVLVKNSSWGVATNLDGKYEILLPAGDYVLVVSFVGYKSITRNIDLTADTQLDFYLEPAEMMLNEVEISGIKPDENVTSTQMSMQRLDVKVMERLPAFMGEVDIIKTIQLLPGITSTSEGGSGYSVRGGSSDQNLVLLDMAPLYNVSHIMGFFSVFNHDAIQNATLYKGDIPPYAGGRLSSYLEVAPRFGNSERFSGKGGLGTISSRLTLDGPIGKKSTFLISGRRTYADLMLQLSSDPAVKENKLNFYDLNASYRFTINERNRIFFTGYNGKDDFSTDFSFLNFGNTLGSLHWNHIFSPNMVSELYLTATRYNYKFGGGPDPDLQISLESLIDDVGATWQMKYKVTEGLEALWGVSSTKHTIRPGVFKGEGDSVFFDDLYLPVQNSWESAVFFGINPEFGDRLKFKIGGRLNMFNNVGPGTVYNYNETYEASDSTVHSKGIYNTFVRFEPRIGFTLLLNNATSIKGSYNQNYQFLQLARNSTGGTPFDIWFTSSPNIQPQRLDQFSLGLFKNLNDNHIELSVEGFYKDYKNTVDFRDFANLFFNPRLEGEVRVGDSWAYGMEFLARFTYERWYGWIGYTLSRAERKIPDINDGLTYLSPFDKTHDVSVVANYQVNRRLSLSASWVYATGQPMTGPTGRYELGNEVIPIYSRRNELRFPDYHRFDVSATFQLNKTNQKRYQHSLNLSVYNVYNRHNAWAINYIPDANDPTVLQGELTYLFPVLPSLTYNFNF